MLNELEKLLLIQSLDIQKREVQGAIDQIPRVIETLQQKIAAHDQDIKSRTEELEDQRKLQRKLEADLQDNEGKLVKLNVQLNQIKSNEDYRAMLKQMDNIKYQNSEIESAILETFEDIDNRKIDVKKFKLVVEDLRKEINKAVEEKNAEMEQLTANRNELLAELKETRKSLSRDLLAHYDKLVSQNRFPAVAAIDGESCSGCHIAMRPKLVIEVKRDDQIYTCENCFRMIYWKGEGEQETPES